MRQSTIGIDTDDDILGDSHGSSWSPSDLHRWHRILHVSVQDVRLFASKCVIDFNGPVVTSLSNVFVLWIISNAECLILKRSQSVLMGDFNIRVFDVVKLEFLGHWWKIVIILVLLGHHGLQKINWEKLSYSSMLN